MAFGCAEYFEMVISIAAQWHSAIESVTSECENVCGCRSYTGGNKSVTPFS